MAALYTSSETLHSTGWSGGSGRGVYRSCSSISVLFKHATYDESLLIRQAKLRSQTSLFHARVTTVPSFLYCFYISFFFFPFFFYTCIATLKDVFGQTGVSGPGLRWYSRYYYPSQRSRRGRLATPTRPEVPQPVRMGPTSPNLRYFFPSNQARLHQKTVMCGILSPHVP